MAVQSNNLFVLEKDGNGDYTGQTKPVSKLAGGDSLRLDRDLQLVGDLNLDGAIDVSGVVALGASGGAADTTIRGDLTVEENLGVDGSLTVTNDLIVNGSAFVRGERLEVDATIQLHRDNLLIVGSGPSGLMDGGLLVERHYSAWGAVTASGTAQAGAGSAVTLAAGASVADDAYNDYSIAITGGTGAGQQRTIVDYVGATKVATVDRAWETQPDETSEYELHQTADRYVGLVWDESADAFRLGRTHKDPGGSNVVFEDSMDLKLGALTVDSTLGVNGQADFAGNIDASGGLDIDADNQSLTIGAGGDLSLVHDGTNSTIANATGNLILDLGHATNSGTIQAKLGVDDGTQHFGVYNNSGTAVFYVTGAGAVNVTGNVGRGSGDLVLHGGMGGGAVSIRANGSGVANGIDVSSSLVTSYQHLVPSADSSKTLGSSTAAWSTGYFDTLTSLDANGYVQIGSSTVALRLPNLNDTEVGNLAAVAAGGLVWNTTDSEVQVYNGSAWVAVGGSGTVTGTTNLTFTVNSDGGGDADEDASLVLISDNGSNKDTGTLTYVAGVLGGSDRSDFGTWLYSANVKLVDAKQLVIGTDDDVTIAWDNGGGLLDINVTGIVELDASGAIRLESSAGTINIGADDVDQNVNIGTDGERTVTVGSVNGAAALTLQAGTGALTLTAGDALNMNVTGAATLDAASISLDAASASNFTVTGGDDLTLETVGGGDVVIASSMDLTINSTTLTATIGGSFSLEGADASNISVDDASLTIETTTSGDVVITAAGVVDVNSNVSMASTKEYLEEGFTAHSTAGSANNETFYVTAEGGNLAAAQQDCTAATGSVAKARLGGVYRTGDKAVLPGHRVQAVLIEANVAVAIGDVLYGSVATKGRLDPTVPQSGFKVRCGIALTACDGSGGNQTVKAILVSDEPVAV